MTGQIFISYRRQDSGYATGRLFDRLREHFGETQVFMDIDTIKLGVDFTQTIDEAIGTCAVVLAIIGRDWLDSVDAKGRRRLDDPGDFVRQEIGAALVRDIPVIPVFFDDATMPPESSLPDVLAPLTSRNGMAIRQDRFDADARELIESLEEICKKERIRDRAEGNNVPSDQLGRADAKRPSTDEAVTLGDGEQIILSRREGISKRFWRGAHRAELVITTQRLVFHDLEEASYSFEMPLPEARDATYSFNEIFKEATIKTKNGRKHKVGIEDENLYAEFIAAVRWRG